MELPRLLPALPRISSRSPQDVSKAEGQACRRRKCCLHLPFALSPGLCDAALMQHNQHQGTWAQHRGQEGGANAVLATKMAFEWTEPAATWHCGWSAASRVRGGCQPRRRPAASAPTSRSRLPRPVPSPPRAAPGRAAAESLAETAASRPHRANGSAALCKRQHCMAYSCIP